MSITSVDIPICKWTLVAADIKQGRVRITLEDPAKYYYAIVPAGDPAPSNTPIIGTMFPIYEMNINYRESIDLYMVAFSFPGRVEFDTDASFTDTFIQDQTTPVVDLYAFIEDGTFEVAVGVAIDDTDFTAVDASAMTVGDAVCFQEGSSFMQALILDIIVNQVFLDTPFDFPYTTAGGCTFGDKNLNVDGSLSPLIARVGPGNLADGNKWDVVRTVFSITDQTSMDDARFGGIPGLIKGIVLRSKNGITKNIFNVKTNGQMRLRNFDAEYTQRAPSGFFGFSSRRTFGGQSKNGVVLRLAAITNDQIQIIIQDDLTDLDTFEIIIQGHSVE